MAKLTINPHDYRANQAVSENLLLARAYEIAHEAHFDARQVRGNGEPYIFHHLRVARAVTIHLVELPIMAIEPYTKAQVQAAAVLHDVPEDTNEKWTVEIGKLDYMTLLLSLELRNASEDYEGPKLDRAAKKAMDFKGLYERASIAALLIKTEDRIDNNKSAFVWKPRRRWRYAQEGRLLLPVLEKIGRHSPFVERVWREKIRPDYMAALEAVEASVEEKDRIEEWV